MPKEYKFKIRDLRDGGWYWVPKVVIQEYVPKVGPTGITVYNFLASLADKEQRCFPSQRYIAKSLGYSRATISRTLKLLEKEGLIKIEKRSRYYCIYHLLRVRCKASETQMLNGRNSDVAQMDINNNKLTKNNNNIVIIKTFKRFKPETKEELLALDLAQGLNDLTNLNQYLSYVQRYPESLLRKILGEVKEIPSFKITKGRGALFNYLLKKYVQGTQNFGS